MIQDPAAFMGTYNTLVDRIPLQPDAGVEGCCKADGALTFVRPDLVFDVLTLIVADEDTAMEKRASSVEEDEAGDGAAGVKEVASGEQVLAGDDRAAKNGGFD